MTDRSEPDAQPSPDEPSEAGSSEAGSLAPEAEDAAPREPRPMIERVGLACIALLLAVLFGVVSVASWFGGELFLAVMAGVGCLMTIWVGTLTLVRG